MLGGQDLGGHQQCALHAGARRRQHRQEGHRRLAAADVALHRFVCVLGVRSIVLQSAFRSCHEVQEGHRRHRLAVAHVALHMRTA